MNHARRDLCGGCAEMCIPTAMGPLRKPVAIGNMVLLQKFGCVVANAKMESASRSIPGEA